MAVNVTVRDLINYPGTQKTVVVNLSQITPLGYGGDEQWVTSATTTATSSGSAAIQDIFIQEFIVGWSKSTGFNQGPYTISATQKNMKVSIDASTAREISLTEQANPVSGDSVASDMQAQIRALADTGASEAGNLSFKNAIVDFSNGRFLIESGSTSTTYTGTNRSSVVVTAGSTNDVSVHLGFFAPIESETIAGLSVDETYVSFPYTAASGLTYIDVNDSSIASTGECIGITDGTNTEYRYVSSVAAAKININTALSNNYTTNSRIQALRMQDPEVSPVSVFNSVDEATRYAIAGIVNQIDFS